MRTFLERFYEYIKSPEGFNCVEFKYNGINYQVSEGNFLSYNDKQGTERVIRLPNDIEAMLDEKVLADQKSLREIWSSSKEFELSPEFY